MDSNIKAGFVSGLSHAYGKAGSYARVVSVLFIMFSMLSIFSSGQSQAQNAICSVYNTVEGVVFILGLTLMILGGALYGGSHIMPGQTRGTIQGYAMGMVLGGVIGVIIAVLAPYLITLITGNNVNQITAACS
ncbi:MAG: hypothetical protein ACP5FR_03445 [Candidatus Micrarchaeia archaeon]